MEKYQHLNPEEFKAMMSDDVVILDVRTAPETDMGIISGALTQFDIHESDFDQKIEDLDPDKTYLIYCRSGAALGFAHLYNLRGGIIAWHQAFPAI